MPPEGYEILPPYGKFGEKIGPIYFRHTAAGGDFGIAVSEEHCGHWAFLHGGMLAALIDTGFTWVARQRYDAGFGMVTTALSIDFMAGAQPGDWVEARVEILRTGRRLAFLSCVVWKDAERIARASAQFQIIARAERPIPSR